MHIAELRAVALVEDDDDAAIEAVEAITRVFLTEKDRELLNGGYDDMALAIVELAMQHAYVGVGVGTILLEIVVLLHGLIVEVFAVDDEEHFINFGHTRGELRRFE